MNVVTEFNSMTILWCPEQTAMEWTVDALFSKGLDVWRHFTPLKHTELPVDQPPAVALTAFADAWPWAIETEVGAALCAIGHGKDFVFLTDSLPCILHSFIWTVCMPTYISCCCSYIGQLYT